MNDDKSPLQSKKFIFAMTCNIAWLGILLYAIRSGTDVVVLTSIIYTAGATQTLYLGGQSAVDAWVRGKTNSNSIQQQQQSQGKINLPGPKNFEMT
mgnify:CR=1 FL=1